MYTEHDNSRDENQPVEGFERLYHVYEIIIEEPSNSIALDKQLAGMEVESLCLLASLARSKLILEELYEISNNYVPLLVELARNSSTPQDLLTKMSYYKSEDVVAAVAANRNTPTTVLQTLSKSDIAHIRRVTTSNPSLSIEALQELLEDKNSLVVSDALRALRNRNDSVLYGMPANWVRKILG